MADILFQYPLDLTGALSTNRVTVPVKLGSGGVNRSFAFPAGPFYADSLLLYPTSDPSVRYVRGTHYELIFAHPVYQKMTGNKEIVMAVVVTDPSVPTDIVAKAQVVGGPQSANIDGIKQAIAELNIDNYIGDWKDLYNVPDTFPGAPAYKDLGDIFGFEYIIAAITGITDGINSGNTVQLEEIKALVVGLKNNLMTALTAHIIAEGNVHNLDIHQANGLTETEIRSLIQSVQHNIDVVLTDIGNLQAADATLDGKIDAVVSSMATWQSQLNQVNLNYQKVMLALANLDSAVSALSKRVTDHDQEISSLKSRVATLETANQDTAQKIQDLTAKLDALTVRVTTAEGAIATTQQSLISHTAADDPHNQYLHKKYGGVVNANVHVNATLSTKDDVIADAGQV